MICDDGWLRALADGASLLGSGGGGDCELGHAMVAHRLSQAGATSSIIGVPQLDPTDLVVHVALYGSPEVVAEQVPGGDEFGRAVAELSQRLGREARAIGTVEIGGINALIPFLAAADLGLPVVDSDLMGRAFPRLTQNTLAIGPGSPGPVVLMGSTGTTVVLDGLSWANTDAMVHDVVGSMGGSAATALFAMSSRSLTDQGIIGSVSRAIRMGQALSNLLPGASMEDVARALDFSLLLRGKVLDVVISPGGLRNIIVEDDDLRRVGRIDAMDEFVSVAIDGRTAADLPDAIVVLDEEDLRPAQVDTVHVGQRVGIFHVTSSSSSKRPRWWE